MAEVLNSSREHAVQQLFIENSSYIRELCSSDPRMSAAAQEQILEGIARHLPSYRAALTDAAFQSWAAEIVAPLVGFHAIRHLCQPFVRKAIWRTLGHAEEPNLLDDHVELVKELEQEVWLWVFINLKKLQKHGTAKITTRVYKRAVWIARDWLKRQRTRRFAVIRKVYNLPSKAKMKDAAEKLAKELDAQRAAQHLERIEREEILSEMEKSGVYA